MLQQEICTLTEIVGVSQAEESHSANECRGPLLLLSRELAPHDQRAGPISRSHRGAEFAWGGGLKERSRSRMSCGMVQLNSFSEEPCQGMA